MPPQLFGRIANALFGRSRKDPEPQLAKPETRPGEALPSRPPPRSDASIGASRERAVGSMSPSGGSHTYSPTLPRRDVVRRAKDEPRRADVEGENAPKGLWADPHHERLSDPFADRPSREYPRHSQSIH